MAISPTNYRSSINFNNQVLEMPYASNHSSVSYASLINPNLPDNRLRENADRSIELIPKDFGYVIGESIHKVAGSFWSAVTEGASRITKFVSSLNILPVVEATVIPTRIQPSDYELVNETAYTDSVTNPFKSTVPGSQEAPLEGSDEVPTSQSKAPAGITVEAKEPEPEFIIIDGSESSDILSEEELEIIVHTASANRHMWSGNIDEALKEFKIAIEKVENCKEKCTPNFTKVLEELKALYKELKASYNVGKKRSTASQ